MSMIERLHLAVIQAVAILNAVPDRDACKANAILRSALVEYADWMAEQPMSENEREKHRKGHALRKRL